ncbi:MAG TPA: metallophosphoesterase [Solirubrobacteraceae bacterium]|nr:metallophosphoesterase [Solirubrobacteraceae bacterium]
MQRESFPRSARAVLAVLALVLALFALDVAATARADIVLAAAGDIACTPRTPMTATACNQAQTANLIAAAAPTAIAALGDDQYDSGTLSEFQGSWARSWGMLTPPIFPAPGNHEYVTANAQGYFDYFNGVGAQTGRAGDRSKGYYSFDLGSWHIVALNSNCTTDASCAASISGFVPPGEVQWLQNDLAAHPSTCTLAYWHHPLFSSGNGTSSSGVKPLWDALYAAGADVVLNGHTHAYERYAPQDPSGNPTARGLREFVVGTGGEDLLPLGQALPNTEVRSASSFGVLFLTLQHGGYAWTFRNSSGSFFDAGSGNCHFVPQGPAPPPTTPSAGSVTPPGDQPQAALIGLTIARQRIADALKHGLAVTVRCSRRCGVAIELRLTRSTAQSGRRRGRHTSLAGSATADLDAAGSSTIRVPFRRAVARRLRGARSAKLTVTSVARDDAGDAGSAVEASVVLHR